jgi:hypothetical protein
MATDCELSLTSNQRLELSSIAQSRSLPAGYVFRAKLILMLAQVIRHLLGWLSKSLFAPLLIISSIACSKLHVPRGNHFSPRCEITANSRYERHGKSKLANSSPLWQHFRSDPALVFLTTIGSARYRAFWPIRLRRMLYWKWLITKERSDALRPVDVAFQERRK